MFPFSDEELKEAVSNNLEKIQPALRRDGGWAKLVDVKDAVVFVELCGACSGCSASHLTTKNIIERHLKAYIHPDIQVQNVQNPKDKH